MALLASEKTDVLLTAVALFTEKYKNKPKLTGLLGSYINRIQELETAIWEVIDERILSSAVGVQLDKIGAIVGRSRTSIVDDEYRTAIQAQIRINISQGTIDDLLQLALLITANTVEITENFPNGIMIEILGAIGFQSPALLGDLFFRCRAAGKELRLRYANQGLLFGVDINFHLGQSADPETSGLQGFGSVSSTTGGRLLAMFDPTPATVIKLAAMPDPTMFSDAFSDAFL